MKRERKKSNRIHLLAGFVVAVLLMCLGVGSWLFGAAVSTGVLSVSGSTELPLGDIQSIAVDSHGRFFCGSGAYGRIQVYDADGKFLHGWQVNAAGGSYYLRLLNDDLIRVASVRGNKVFTYDPEGNEVQAPEDEDKGERDGHEYWSSGKQAKGPNGNLYIARYSSVYLVESSGSEIRRVGVPLHLWLIMSPYPAWFVGVAGMVLGLVFGGLLGVFPIVPYLKREWKSTGESTTST